MTKRRWLTIPSYFGLAPFLLPIVARRDDSLAKHHIRQALALFFVLWTLLVVYAAYVGCVSWMLAHRREVYQSIPLFTCNVAFCLSALIWVIGWLVGLLLAIVGSDHAIPVVSRLASRRLPVRLSVAATLLAWVATVCIVPMAIYSVSLTRNDEEPAQVYMLYDDIAWVPRWVFTLGFYRISLAAQEHWGAGHVVVAPLSRESLNRAIHHGRFVFVGSHGGGLRGIALPFGGGEGSIYTPSDAQRAGPGRGLQFIYFTACDGGRANYLWESALYPAEVVTFNRLSAVIEHAYWPWFEGPNKLATRFKMIDKLSQSGNPWFDICTKPTGI